MANFYSILSEIQNGEDVSAAIANRPLLQLLSNTQWLKDRITEISASEALYAREVAIESSVLVGQPVYWNSSTDRYEAAIADGTVKENVTGLVYSKSGASIGDVVLLGLVELDISAALSVAVAASRYWLSATTAGMLVSTPPANHSILVCTADGDGNIVVTSQISDNIVQGAYANGTSIAITNSTISVTQNVSATATPTFAGVRLSGAANAALLGNVTANGTVQNVAIGPNGSLINGVLDFNTGGGGGITAINTTTPTSLSGLVVGNGTLILPARSVVPTSGRVSIANGTGVNGNIGVDIVEANLSLANLSGIVAVASGGTGAANATAARTNLGAQTQDATLDALAAFNSNGLLTQTAAATFTARSVVAGSGLLTVANGTGAAGNITINIVEANLSLANMSGITAVASGGTGAANATAARTNLGAQAQDATLDSLAAFNSNGLLTQTSADTFAARAVVAGSGLLTVANGTGAAGDIVVNIVEANLSLANLSGVTAIGSGGTGATTANSARNNLLPSQVANSTLQSDGTNVSFTQEPVLNNLTLNNVTASRAVVTDSGKKLAASATTATELGYVSGVTSAIQTQIDGKQATLNGASNITVNSVTANATTGYSPINNQTGTSYTLALSDAGKFITMNNASLSNLTLPNGTTTAFQVGTEGAVFQLGAGNVTLVAGSGVTMLLPPGRTATSSGQNATLGWKLIAADTYATWGDLAATP